MDIRKYFGGVSLHNTRKQTNGSTECHEKESNFQDIPAVIKKDKHKSKKRIRVISDSSDEGSVIEESSTPTKKSKLSEFNKPNVSSKPAIPLVQTSATNFFGSKLVTVGSKEAPKNETPKKTVPPQKTKEKKSKNVATHEEIMIVDDEDWSDDESFTQILESESKGRKNVITENHTDEEFNKTLEHLDKKSKIKSYSPIINEDLQSKGDKESRSQLKQSNPESKNPSKPEINTSKNTSKMSDSKKDGKASKSPLSSESPPSKSLTNKLKDKKDKESENTGVKSKSPKEQKGDKKPPTGHLAGLTFVLTGQMERYERDEAKDLIVKFGGRVVSAVSGKVNYLVSGEDAGQSKLAKAEKNPNLKIINEREFLELLGPVELNCKENEVVDRIEDYQAKVGEQEKTPKKELKSTKSAVEFSSSFSNTNVKPLSSSNQSQSVTESVMWVDKYKPTSVNKIVGQSGDKSNANKLLHWLQNWHKHKELGTKPVSKFGGYGGGDSSGAGFKAALLSGPPGIGKTTTAVLVCKEAGFSFFEMNASDSRNKRTLQEVIGEASNNTTLLDFASKDRHEKNSNKKHCIIMDEVDGMAGNEDRGGMQELIQLIKNTHIPVICICNDRQSQKVRSLANHCFDLRFQRPRVDQIKAAMMSVCFKEGVKIEGSTLGDIIEASNHDIRQVLHNLSVWSAADKNLPVAEGKSISFNAKKDLTMDPFTACRITFSESDNKTMSMKDKSDLFFYDYSLHPLFIQENYIHAKPHSCSSQADTLRRLAKAVNCISMGDVVSKAIRADRWSLLPMQAMFSSVLPGDAMMGHLTRQIEFPKWLGKFSTTNKNFRLAKEIALHMKLCVSGSAREICLDYFPMLNKRLTRPLIYDEQNGVQEVIDLMQLYELQRDDYDSILEISQWPGQSDLKGSIDSKVKASFTRSYNKSSHKTHYSVMAGPVKKKKLSSVNVEEDEGLLEEAQDGSEGEESDDEIINALKVKPKAGATKSQATKKKEQKQKEEKKPRSRASSKKK